MKVILKKREEIADNYVILELDTLGQKIEFSPGQFFILTLINPAFTDNRGNSRFFGFTNLPNQEFIQILYKKGPSAFKKSLQHMTIGSELDVDKINGKKELEANDLSPIIFIALGVGIAPIISMIRYIAAQNLNILNNLIYISNTPSTAPFILELEILSKESDNFKLVSSTEINENLIKSVTPNPLEFKYIISGEAKDVILTNQILKNIGIDSGKISTEIFTGY